MKLAWARVSSGVVAGLIVAAGALALASACGSDAAEQAEDASAPGRAPDAGREGGRTTTAPPPREGGCSRITGACDLVLQDCPQDGEGRAQECVPRAREDGTYEAACVTAQASQQLPVGRACCPNAPGGNTCLPGLSCIGRPCEDGGLPTGRCAPPCCPGDDQACGRSDPEGIAGLCDLTLVDTTSNAELYFTCSYRERCKPFGQEPCREGQACLVDDVQGSASCIGSFGKALGEPCGFANDCQDGLGCITAEDGGTTCRMACLTPGAVHPFDPSVEDGGPRKGGCPPESTCNVGPIDGLPAWLSFCR